MTVEELIQKLSLLNPNAKVVFATNPDEPSFHAPHDATYFRGLSDWSTHFDPDAVGGKDIIYISSFPEDV